MQITLNGEAYTLSGALSISNLLKELDLDIEKVAVERNTEVLPHSLYDHTKLSEGDMLEIIHFIGGG